MKNHLFIRSQIDMTIKINLSQLENINTQEKYTFLYFKHTENAKRVKRMLHKPLVAADDIVILDNATHNLHIYF